MRLLLNMYGMFELCSEMILFFADFFKNAKIGRPTPIYSNYSTIEPLIVGLEYVCFGLSPKCDHTISDAIIADCSGSYMDALDNPTAQLQRMNEIILVL